MDRLDILIDGARRTGYTIDFLEALTQGLSNQACRRLIGNVSAMPSYMKSNDTPYVRRISSAPLSDSRVEPDSQLE